MKYHFLWSSSENCNYLFFENLSRLSTCQKGHLAPMYSNSQPGYIYRHHKTRRKQILESGRVRFAHTTALTTRPIITAPPTRDELLNLVDTYREYYTSQASQHESASFIHLPPNSFTIDQERAFPPAELLLGEFSASPPPPPVLQPANATGILDESKKADFELQPQVDGPMKVTRNPAEHLAMQAFERTLKNPKCTHHQAFEAYSSLPSPGVSFLDHLQIRQLFRCLSTVEKKDKQTALQYLSVVDDMKRTGLPLCDGEWNSAIAFCGQCYSHVRDEHVENALESWKEMEQHAGTKAGVVTFNILFDMAAKSGKYVLGEMILKEMEVRGLEPNRYSRVSRIYFYGLRRDGDGVRRAYRNLVEAKEIVDTVVLNCVIAALITAGELASAEHVYGRMKQLLATRTGQHPAATPTWRENRELGRLFDHLARERRSQPRRPLQKSLRQRISFSPNLHTFAIFIEHHASKTGDLHRIAALLGEMKALDVPIHGRIFLKLFKGFTIHGAQIYSDWTSWRLKKIYASLLAALDNDGDGGGGGSGGGGESVQVRRWLVVWAVRAFDHCAGRDWALHVWRELVARWKPDARELDLTYRRLADILDDRGEEGRQRQRQPKAVTPIVDK